MKTKKKREKTNVPKLSVARSKQLRILNEFGKIRTPRLTTGLLRSRGVILSETASDIVGCIACGHIASIMMSSVTVSKNLMSVVEDINIKADLGVMPRDQSGWCMLASRI